jgi:hypothetical protein
MVRSRKLAVAAAGIASFLCACGGLVIGATGDDRARRHPRPTAL